MESGAFGEGLLREFLRMSQFSNPSPKRGA